MKEVEFKNKGFIIKETKKKMKRYELKTGKFGYYFYDSTIEIDMTLEIVLSRLNYYENQLNNEKQTNNNLKIEIIRLNRKITMLNEVKPK